MNKAELVAALETRLGSRKAAADALEAVIDTIQRAVVRGEKVAISGFGSFEKAVRNARTGRNPRTGEKVKIKKTSVPRFRPGTAFKGYVADPKTPAEGRPRGQGGIRPRRAAKAPARATATRTTHQDAPPRLRPSAAAASTTRTAKTTAKAPASARHRGEGSGQAGDQDRGQDRRPRPRRRRTTRGLRRLRRAGAQAQRAAP